MNILRRKTLLLVSGTLALSLSTSANAQGWFNYNHHGAHHSYGINAPINLNALLPPIVSQIFSPAPYYNPAVQYVPYTTLYSPAYAPSLQQYYPQGPGYNTQYHLHRHEHNYYYRNSNSQRNYGYPGMTRYQ